MEGPFTGYGGTEVLPILDEDGSGTLLRRKSAKATPPTLVARCSILSSTIERRFFHHQAVFFRMNGNRRIALFPNFDACRLAFFPLHIAPALDIGFDLLFCPLEFQRHDQGGIQRWRGTVLRLRCKGYVIALPDDGDIGHIADLAI